MTQHAYARLGFRPDDDAGKLVTTRRALLAAVVVAAIAGVFALFQAPANFRGEDGALEWMQIALLTLGAIIALAKLTSRPTARDRWNVFWLCIICAGMAWRELDGHIWLNSPNLGIWALHYRVDWLTDAHVPWYVKAFWLLVFLCGLAALMVPLFMAKPDGLAQLRRRDLGAWLFLTALAAIAAGYASDDLLGRNQFVPEAASQLLEESFELVAALAMLLTVIVAIESRLDVREGKAT